MNILREWRDSIKHVESPHDEGARILWRRVAIPGLDRYSSHGLITLVPLERVQRPGHGPEVLHVVGVPVTPQNIERALWTANLTAALGALLTFAADRRLEVFEEWPLAGEEGKTFFMPLGHMSDKRLEAPPGADFIEKLSDIVSRLVSLHEESADVILAALQLHYGACVLAPVSPTSAYMSAVAGIEVLSRAFGNPPRDWSAWDMARRWDRFMDEANLSAGQAEMLRVRLMKDQHLRLAETFAEYASTSLPESFWTAERFDWIYVGDGTGKHGPGFEESRYRFSETVPTNRQVLKACLKQSYKLRSQFVHTGESEVTYLTPFSAHNNTGGSSGLAEGESGAAAPLPFAVLRSILTSLISCELSPHER